MKSTTIFSTPNVECKKCVINSKKYSFFLSRKGLYIGRHAYKS